VDGAGIAEWQARPEEAARQERLEGSSPAGDISFGGTLPLREKQQRY